MKKLPVLIIMILILLFCICCSVILGSLGFMVYVENKVVYDPDLYDNWYDYENSDYDYDSIPTENITDTPSPTITEKADTLSRESGKTPVEAVYHYIVDEWDTTYGKGTTVEVKSKTKDKMEISAILDSVEYEIWIVEKNNDESTAGVVTGPPNAGGIWYELAKSGNLWEVTEVVDDSGI